MRKTNTALLVAAIMVSPLALANGGGGMYPSGGDTESNTNVGNLDYSATDMFNTDKYVDKEGSYNQETVIDDSFKSSDDSMLMNDIGNEYVDVEIEGSYNSDLLEDNSVWNKSKTYSMDVEIEKYLAESELEGEVTDSEVTYGGACCDSKYGSSDSVHVYQTNTMSGAFGGASGINVAGQNVGNNSLVQQTASTNAALVGQ
ncbi:hypothetical protein [Photobacterium sp.]|uniref:hypothetical protein n=1 Tax=Photobacterium sp. TaxID=660 RepID=UPI00299DDE01|nr:hypothetical protein [Photobacterium sp.]MDX1302189.1 hypothetical protein [Photobacterium sp.]